MACEFSGIVRDAFTALGHDAWSCDLLETERPGRHLRGNVLNLLSMKWDLIIAHPPCTYLCNSGVRWLAPGGKVNPGRQKLMMDGCDLFAQLYHAPCKRVAIENPVMHKYAKDYLLSAWKVPAYTFSLQPWEHGEPETKRTCYWTRGLPDLKPSQIVSGRTPRVHFESPGPDRWKNRSRTLEGVAKAMSLQWSENL